MEDRTLLKICIIFSLIGIFLILIIAENTEPKQLPIASVDSSYLEKDVKIQGKIISLSETPGLYLMNVQDDTGTILVIVFKEEPILLAKGTFVEIQGEVTEYKGQLEITADLIKII